MLKWLVRAVLLLAAVAVLAAAGGYVYLRQSLPEVSGRIALEGLGQPVEIVRDRYAVPHIFARSMTDANFALGFAHAQDRLWQMEMNRRIGSGRLAEALGPKALETDRFLRTLGIRHTAEAAYGKLGAETRAVLDAYAAGVNAFLAQRSGPLPPEFLLLGVRPEPWSPVDSISWIKMMAWDLGGNWLQELLRMDLARRLSPQQIAEFLPPYPGDAPVALADLGTLYRGLDIDVAALIRAAPETLPPGAGSNNWVVAGTRTATGKPLLANDPHLGLTAPPVWYFAHLQADGAQVIGATLPGVPMVLLGHNQRIAWGFTNTGPDVQDLFIEKLDPDDPSRYIAPDGPRPFEIREEVIKVKGAADVSLTVRSTRHGPVISELAALAGRGVPENHVLAFAWTALRDDDLTVQAGVKLATAGNWRQFREALRDFHAPQQNIVYADVDGNIGFIAPGRVPVRKPENELQGRMPAPGWDARYDWNGFIPFDELPQAFNPASGKVVTANHKIVPDDYRYFITGEWAEPYRARRIEQMLAARDVHSLASFMAMQGDVRSAMVQDFLPLLLRVRPSGEMAVRAVDHLRGWNGEMTGSRPEPLILAAWLRELTRLVYADELGETFAFAWAMRPIFMHNVLSDTGGQGRWCDDVATPAIETCADRLAAALDAALEDLTRRYGGDMERWRWEDAHVADSQHRPLTSVPVLGRLFDIRVPSPGGTYTVNAGHYRITNEEAPFANRHAASFRAIYDLGDLDRSVFMHSGGQSGNRLSPRYDDFARPWASLEYIPMSTKRSDIDAGSLGTLVLQPPGTTQQ